MLGDLQPDDVAIDPDLIYAAWDSVQIRDPQTGLISGLDISKGSTPYANLAIIHTLIQEGIFNTPLADGIPELKNWGETMLSNIVSVGNFNPDLIAQGDEAEIDRASSAITMMWMVKEIFKGKEGLQSKQITEALGLNENQAGILRQYADIASDVYQLGKGLSVSPEGKLTSVLSDKDPNKFLAESIREVSKNPGMLSRVRELLHLSSDINAGVNIESAASLVRQGGWGATGLMSRTIPELLGGDTSVPEDYVKDIQGSLNTYQIGLPTDKEDEKYKELEAYAKRYLTENTFAALQAKESNLPFLVVLGEHMKASEKPSPVIMARLGTILEASQDTERFGIGLITLLKMMAPIEEYTIGQDGTSIQQQYADVGTAATRVKIGLATGGVNIADSDKEHHIQQREKHGTDPQGLTDIYWMEGGINVNRKSAGNPLVYWAKEGASKLLQSGKYTPMGMGTSVTTMLAGAAGFDISNETDKSRTEAGYNAIMADIKLSKETIKNNLSFERNDTYVRALFDGNVEHQKGWDKTVEEAMDKYFGSLDPLIHEALRTGDNSFSISNQDMMLGVLSIIMKENPDIKYHGISYGDLRGTKSPETGVLFFDKARIIYNSSTGSFNLNGKDVPWEMNPQEQATNATDYPTQYTGESLARAKHRKRQNELIDEMSTWYNWVPFAGAAVEAYDAGRTGREEITGGGRLSYYSDAILTKTLTSALEWAYRGITDGEWWDEPGSATPAILDAPIVEDFGQEGE